MAVSNEAVKKATHKSWTEWFRILDRAGAQSWPHREIAEYLKQQHRVPSWWCQMVTVQYEYTRKGRKRGETAEAGFEIGVTKTLPIQPERAWRFLLSPRGRSIWLGSVKKFAAVPGVPFRTTQGTTGEVRTVRAGDRLRLTWQPKGWKQPTTLQLTVIPRRSMRGTCIAFHQEKLPSATSRRQMRKRWQAALARIANSIR